MTSVEFYFDCASPWTYLGFERIQPLAQEMGAAIEWKPILLGGVFNAVNDSVYRERDNPIPAKETYVAKDLADWARHVGIDIIWCPSVFPVNSVKAMRGCLVALDQDCLVPFARALFRAYWGRDEDISQEAVLAAAAGEAGLDSDELIAGLSQQPAKDRLRANTEELIERGGFGSPTLFLGDDMYFGNDRLPLVRAALEVAKAG